MNYKQILCNIFFIDDWKLNRSSYIKYCKNKDKFINISQYLHTCFNDSQSIKETLYRIKHHINKRPTCKTCGNDIEFLGKRGILFRRYCSDKCAQNSDEVKRKKDITDRLNHNGIREWNNSKYFTKDRVKKERQTKLLKYGNPTYMNNEKRKLTCIERYGGDNPMSSVEVQRKRNQTIKEKYNNENFFDTLYYKEKSYETKKKNKTFNCSKMELDSYVLLKDTYINVIRQYSDDRYPFACDFYIPNLDLFIECNYHWTHGYKPFEDTEEDRQKLEKWRNKNTKYYQNAIKTWTDLDVRKQKIAKENKLNYLVFYTMNELKNWLENNRV